MNILDAIKNKLVTETVGTFGTNLFIGEFPQSKENSLMLVSAPSPTPNLSIGVYDQYVDFWVRYKNTDDAYSKLEEVKEIFHRTANYVIGDYHVYLSNLVGGIDDMDRDNERRKLFKMTMRFIYRED